MNLFGFCVAVAALQSPRRKLTANRNKKKFSRAEEMSQSVKLIFKSRNILLPILWIYNASQCGVIVGWSLFVAEYSRWSHLNVNNFWWNLCQWSEFIKLLINNLALTFLVASLVRLLFWQTHSECHKTWTTKANFINNLAQTQQKQQQSLMFQSSKLILLCMKILWFKTPNLYIN